MFEIWFGWYDLLSLLFKCLGCYLKIWKTLCKAPRWYAKVLPKPYDDTSWKPYTHMLLVFALNFVKLLWPLREFFSCFHDQDSHAHHIPPLLCFFEKLALYHPLIPQNKCSTICVGLSLSLVFVKKEEERHGLSKKNMDMNAQHVELRKNFIYLWNKIRLNARLIIINLRKFK